MGSRPPQPVDIDARYQKALAACKSYTDMFEVEPITFDQIEQDRARGATLMLVDVRTQTEQLVSMALGAVNQAEFEVDLAADRVAPNSIVVPHCTIGYRSGIYATRLLKAPSLPAGCSVRNGQGVVCWSYPIVSALVQRGAGGVGVAPAAAVHTYGSPWNLAHPRYRAEHFGYRH